MVFPELFLAGYPPEDLVLKPAFQAACRAACEELARETGDGGPALLVGTPWREDGKLYNAVALLDGGAIAALRFKVDLPNYGVFDEKRVFAPGRCPGRSISAACASACRSARTSGREDVVECLAETGAEMLLVPNGSPYRRDKADVRLNIAVARVTESGLPLSMSTRSAARTSWSSTAPRSASTPIARSPFQLPAFEEAVVTTVWDAHGEDGWRCDEGPIARARGGRGGGLCACVLGLRDYVDKNGFPGVVLGLSGGIDSAVVAAMAVDALGRERVHCVMLPYRFTSESRSPMPPTAPRRSACATTSCRSRRRCEGFEAVARADLRRAAARHHRGEHAEPRARHHPDGDLQQVRPDGGDDRQQVGDVGRLCHALWRHERRLQPDQGPLQDRGLPPRRGCAIAGSRTAPGPGGRRDPREHPDQARRPPSCARTRRTRTRCRPTRCSTTSSSAWSSARCAVAEIVARGHDEGRCGRSSACSTSPNTSAGRRRRASR